MCNMAGDGGTGWLLLRHFVSISECQQKAQGKKRPEENVTPRYEMLAFAEKNMTINQIGFILLINLA